MLAVFVALCALDLQQTEVSDAPSPEVGTFETPFAIAQPIRLARTPDLDGTISDEEWETLATIDGELFFLQWEPGVLYLAGKASAGRDVVWSLDLKGDGWLVGADNLEIRWDSVTGNLRSRRLDATDRNGPRWLDAGVPDAASRTVVRDGVVEMKLLGLSMAGFGTGDRIGVRVDRLAPAEPLAEPFRPRRTTLITLSLDQTERLPADVIWRSEFLARSVAMGESIGIRLVWGGEGVGKFRRIRLRPEGSAASSLAESAEPFPQSDRRGRATTRYETTVPRDALPGYRVLRATLSDEEGNEYIVRTSFRIAEPIVFDVNLPRGVRVSDSPQVIRGAVTLRSQSMRRLDGLFTLFVPDGWSVARGAERRFTIYFARGGFRIPLEIVAPAGAGGLIPLRYRAEIGTKVVEQVIFLEMSEQVGPTGG